MKLPCAINQQNIVALLALAALGLVLSAFILQYGFGAEPCRMCWWQRYSHWALAVVAGGAWLLRNKISLKVIFVILIALALTSGGIGAWQSAAQLGWLELPEFCGNSGAVLSGAGNLLGNLQPAAGPSCSAIDFTIFGLTLAMWNVITMAGFIAVMVFGLRSK